MDSSDDSVAATAQTVASARTYVGSPLPVPLVPSVLLIGTGVEGRAERLTAARSASDCASRLE